jgi:hypothetical protein
MKKRWLLAVCATAVVCGCSENKITIENEAAGGAYFAFRGARTYVAPGDETTLSDIPNGTFEYSTTIELPSGIHKFSSNGTENGTLIFQQSKTKVLILYGAVLSYDSSDVGTYEFSCNVSSSNNLATPTSP